MPKDKRPGSQAGRQATDRPTEIPMRRRTVSPPVSETGGWTHRATDRSTRQLLPAILFVFPRSAVKFSLLSDLMNCVTLLKSSWHGGPSNVFDANGSTQPLNYFGVVGEPTQSCLPESFPCSAVSAVWLDITRSRDNPHSVPQGPRSPRSFFNRPFRTNVLEDIFATENARGKLSKIEHTGNRLFPRQSSQAAQPTLFGGFEDFQHA